MGLGAGSGQDDEQKWPSSHIPAQSLLSTLNRPHCNRPERRQGVAQCAGGPCRFPCGAQQAGACARRRGLAATQMAAKAAFRQSEGAGWSCGLLAAGSGQDDEQKWTSSHIPAQSLLSTLNRPPPARRGFRPLARRGAKVADGGFPAAANRPTPAPGNGNRPRQQWPGLWPCHAAKARTGPGPRQCARSAQGLGGGHAGPCVCWLLKVGAALCTLGRMVAAKPLVAGAAAARGPLAAPLVAAAGAAGAAPPQAEGSGWAAGKAASPPGAAGTGLAAGSARIFSASGPFSPWSSS